MADERDYRSAWRKPSELFNSRRCFIDQMTQLALHRLERVWITLLSGSCEPLSICSSSETNS